MFTSSIFSQLLKLIDREEFGRLVARHKSDRWRKSFHAWDHLVAMLGVQFSGVTSLRDLETLLNSHTGYLYHCGCGKVSRSTLSDANRARDSAVFGDLALSMLSKVRGDADELKTVLSILDSSPIRLSGRGHDWALATRTRASSQGLKLHVQFAPQAAGMEFIKVTDANVNDITVGREASIEADRIYVFDKGYCDYNWWHAIAQAGSTFVTRLKTNAAFAVIEERPVAAELAADIVSDQTIKLTNVSPRAGKTNALAGTPLRLVKVPHPGGKDKPFWIVSNNLTAGAEEISGCYKQRWAIELLFKWLKQNLKIKRFIGESRNAILIQIYVAIIAYVLLKTFQNMAARQQFKRLKDVLVYVSTNLFNRPKTENWLRKRRREKAKIQPQFWPEQC